MAADVVGGGGLERRQAPLGPVGPDHEGYLGSLGVPETDVPVVKLKDEEYREGWGVGGGARYALHTPRFSSLRNNFYKSSWYRI